MLASAKSDGRLETSFELAGLFDLATDLETARKLTGYADAVTPKRLKSLEYDKDCYVAYVAALGVRNGYEVEFVPTSTTRTPDLLMKLGETALQVECKRKDDYVEGPSSLSAWNLLESKLASLHEHVTYDYEIVVCAVSALNESSVEEIAKHVLQVVKAGEEGEYSGGVPDCTLLIKRGPPQPLGHTDALVIPAWQNPSAAIAKFTKAADGKVSRGPMLRIALYVINSHRLAQVLSSFNLARTQLDPSSGAAGIIFIGVDTSHIHPSDHVLYFQTLAQSVQRLFNPTANTRVAAVVVTGGIQEIEITADRGWHRTKRCHSVIRNPFFPESAQIIVPG
jgi:hypothetical protein